MSIGGGFCEQKGKIRLKTAGENKKAPLRRAPDGERAQRERERQAGHSSSRRSFPRMRERETGVMPRKDAMSLCLTRPIMPG